MPPRASRTLSVLLFGLAAVLAVAAPGCDRGVRKVTVNGTVRYKGQPVPSGILQFVGDGGTYSAAALQSDGTFIITDVVPGEVKVGIQERPQSAGSSSGKDGGPRPAPVSLPPQYRDPQTSGLTYTITPETKALNIDLK